MKTRFIIRKYTVNGPLSAPVRLAMLSDLHSAPPDFLADAVINCNPHAVLLCGDIIDDVLPAEPAFALLKRISVFPCFMVLGNHESRIDRPDGFLPFISELGITLLRNRSTVAVLNGQQISFTGLDDYSFDERGFCPAGAFSATGAYSVLLSHRPEFIKRYLPFGCDLIFSGHAHGGQICLPPLINGFYAPGQGLFPKYAGGLYTFGKTSFIVGRGLELGKNHIPRIFNPRELVLTDILPS